MPAALYSGLTLLLCAGPFLVLLGLLLTRRAMPWLAALPSPERPRWPRLSVIVPACNEAATLEPALGSLLAEDYPELEIVLIDDRSTDGTGEIVDRLAARDPRVVPVHVRALPEGWLGKVHALARGVDQASGSWLLFTDADVHFRPGALRRAVAYAEDHDLGHLAVFPEVPARTFWLAVALSGAFRSILALGRIWEASDPRKKTAVGVGAFNLVAREALARTPGLEWLRMEVADDFGLGLLLKQSGARAGALLGRGMIRVEWYTSLADLVGGLEKNGFAQAARFSLLRGLLMGALCWLLPLGPALALLPFGHPWLPLAGLASWTAFAASTAVSLPITGLRTLPALLSLPLGEWLLGWVIVRATVLGVRRGGLVWRGTTYPIPALRAGQRVRM